MTSYRKDFAEKVAVQKICTVTGCRHTQGDVFGIELENELDANKSLGVVDMQRIIDYGFKVSADGSLRGTAYEFISRPCTAVDLKNNLTALQNVAKKYEWSYSRRTSTHIHINFADKTALELVKFLALYWIFEPLLLTTVKPSRVDNTFCTPSVSTCNDLVLSLKAQQTFDRFADENATKYASLNLTPLWKLGTVECRVFHSTFNAKELFLWLDFLEKLLISSRGFNSLEDIRSTFIKTPAKEFASSILGDVLPLVAKPGVNIPELVREGFRKTVQIFQLDEVFTETRNYIEVLRDKERKILEEITAAMKNKQDIADALKKLKKLAVKGDKPEVVVAEPVAVVDDLDWFLDEGNEVL